MSIFVFPQVPKTPTYGNWGGPGHSGFDRNPDGSVKRDEGSHKALIASGKEPIDNLDACFYRHDCVYQDFADGLATKRDILIADLKLIHEVAHLDPTSKGYPTDPYGLAYMDAIKPVFELKLMYDLMRIDNFNDEELNEIWRRCLKDYPNDWIDPLWDAHRAIDSAEGLFDMAAAAPPPGSPIILDLDGDGVETTGIKSGAYFDHDGNGFAEQTGWAVSDDGLLVLDRNGDGTINDGKELFGDQTILQNGQRAVDGFQALAELDNNADGIVDADDVLFSRLKVWKDIDGDGYSAHDELFTLDELGIRSINTAYDTSDYIDANGNEHRQAGSYEKTNGEILAATDVWFKTDKTCTIVNEWLDVPDPIASLPSLQGYGNVYDLHQAMAREVLAGQPSGVSLKDLVGQFVEAADVAARNSLMEQILFKWTGSEAVDPESRGGLFDARKLAVLETLFGRAYVGTTGENPHHAPAPYLERAYNGIFEMYYAQLMAQTHMRDLYDMITYTWDKTSHNIKGDLSAVIADIQNTITADLTGGKAVLGEFARTIRGFQAKDVLDFTEFRNAFAEQDEDLRWIIDSAGKDVITGTAGNDTLYGYEVNNAVAGGGGNDSLYASYDMTGNGVLYGNAGSDSLTGGEDNDILNGGADDDYLFGAGGSDLLEGGDGDDYIDGGPGSDTIAGGAGNDYIQSSLGGSDTYLFSLGDGQDTIYEYDYEDTDIDTIKFGPGITKDDILITRKDYDLVFEIKNTADTITILNWYSGGNYPKIESLLFTDGTTMTQAEIEGRATFRGTEYEDSLGNGGYNTGDIFEGGSGNDTLCGGEGSDTYLFNKGDGQDTISEYDHSGGDIDTIKTGPGITKDDILITRKDYNLVFEIKGTKDSITVENWYGGGDCCKIESLLFSDGTSMTQAEIEKGVIVRGGDTGDCLSGLDTGEVFDSAAGDDHICGYGGNDTITGGHGEDYLDGGSGSDVYRFSSGDGSDIIYDCGYDGAIDSIIFDPDVPADSIAFFRDNTGLNVAYGSTDRILLPDQDTAGIERVQAGDKWYLTGSDINNLIQQMAAYAAENGIPLTGADDVKKNQELMSIVVNAWHQ